MLDDEGKLDKFVSVGLTNEQIERIPHQPVGLGLLGALMNADDPIRVSVIANDPRSVGFPPNHPNMTSFLGVPIRTVDRQLGQLYLADKIDAPEFTEDDEKIIQMLAAYAAAAIQNAQRVEQMKEHDAVLTRRSEDLLLLNNLASALTSSLEQDEILDKTLAVVLNYVKAEAGEIFLLEEDGQTLRMDLHRGQAAEAFWSRTRFKMGEGIVGLVAEKGEAILSSNLEADDHFLREAVAKAGFRQMVCLPLHSGEKVIGVMTIATRSVDPIDEASVRLLEAAAANRLKRKALSFWMVWQIGLDWRLKMRACMKTSGVWPYWRSVIASAWICMTALFSPFMALGCRWITLCTRWTITPTLQKYGSKSLLMA